MKTFLIIHTFDVDGGFGDAITKEEIIASFTKYEDAEAYVAKYSHPYIYDNPYDNLWCGNLTIQAVNSFDSLEEAPEFQGFERNPCLVEKEKKEDSDDFTVDYEEFSYLENKY